MWFDKFDGDLYQLTPEAQPILARVADIQLMTHGRPDDEGKLNHPTVWNDYSGMIAFFGMGKPYKPGVYHTSDPVIACTAEEAIRDCFVHQYAIILNAKYPVYDSFQYRNRYISLLYDHRGIRPMQPADKARFITEVLRDLKAAVNKILLMKVIAPHLGITPEQSHEALD